MEQFGNVHKKFGKTFAKDRTHNLIVRLGHNVINTIKLLDLDLHSIEYMSSGNYLQKKIFLEQEKQKYFGFLFNRNYLWRMEIQASVAGF